MKKTTFFVILPAVAMLVIGSAVCGGSGKTEAPKQGAVTEIRGIQSFKDRIDSSKDRLLVFDLYADWCVPCGILSPLLEKIAAEHRERASVYKINIDKNPEIAAALGVSGIPFVVFIKNGKAVQAFTGVQPEDVYARAILRYGAGDESAGNDRPDGELVNGVRIIKLTTATSPGNLYVYRGEEVKLIVEKVDIPYSIHLPAFDISKKATIGQDLEVEFKAAQTGVFPLFCNGKCPTGDGQRFAQIVVLEYDAADGKAIFKSVDAKKAAEYIKTEKPLILDTRTPHEFYEGYIPGSKLIPVQQLADRIREIEAYKNAPVLVYCRSGNRSIVASQILIRNGFKKVYNLKGGIREWEKTKGAIELPNY